MKSKLFFLSVLYASILIVEGCYCPDVDFLYYDFSSLTFSYDSGTSVAADEDFTFSFEEDSIEYVATNRLPQIGLLTSAYATQPCPREGDSGRKFSISEIAITSNADFDATHPAGTSLADIVEYQGYNRETFDLEWVSFSNADLTSFYDRYYALRITQRPTSAAQHVFTFTVTKSNGESVSGTTEPITWQ